MELEVYNTSGQKGGKVSISDEVFGIEPNDHAIWLDVKTIMANKRQGNHKAKERGEIAGSTRKIKRQKGTGTARAGSLKNPLFRSGGRVFGPRVRDYNTKLNKKTKQLARKSALSYKVKDNSLMVLENFSMEAPKTKEFVSILSNLQVGDKKTLMVVPAGNKNVYLSSRNVPGAKVVTANDINTYDILHAHTMIVCQDSVKEIETLLS